MPGRDRRFYVDFFARPQASINLVCLPWAGSGVAPYRAWAARFPADVEVFGVRLPGRETRLAEPPLDRIDDVVERLVEDFPTLPRRPTVMFGRCMGALLAFELLRALRGHTADCRALLVVDGTPPATHTTGGPAPDMEEELRLYRAAVPNPRAFALLRPGIEADIRLVSRYVYRPGAVLDLPVTLLHPAAEPVEPAVLAAWASETTGAVTGWPVPGGPLIPSAAGWPELADSLGTVLAPYRSTRRS
ncbi:thioesterase II family protein [Actinoplanes subtropicus]|uniref:thioesterase II family protein n=1 Tax=Actinoplanes subtropicus TaxID=543632 RepID=UPI000691C53E|nr:thioesterase domain-containing protein [Actinoplanes subtropicus]